MKKMSEAEVQAALNEAGSLFGTEHMDTDAIVHVMKSLPLDFFCLACNAIVFRLTRPLTPREAWKLGSMYPNSLASWERYDKEKHKPNGNGFEPTCLVRLPKDFGDIWLTPRIDESIGDFIIGDIANDQTTFYLGFDE